MYGKNIAVLVPIEENNEVPSTNETGKMTIERVKEMIKLSKIADRKFRKDKLERKRYDFKFE